MYSFIRLLLHPYSPWCKLWIVLRLLGVWFCITHTHLKNHISAYRVFRTVLKVKNIKNGHVGMPFFHVSIYHTKQWAKKILCSLLCCLLFSEPWKHILLRRNWNCSIKGSGPNWTVLCFNDLWPCGNPLYQLLRINFESSTPNTSLNSNKDLVFIMFKDCVLREGETEYLHTYTRKKHDILQSLTNIKLRTFFLKVGVGSNIVG